VEEEEVFRILSIPNSKAQHQGLLLKNKFKKEKMTKKNYYYILLYYYCILTKKSSILFSLYAFI
jgi:hypothetical protein